MKWLGWCWLGAVVFALGACGNSAAPKPDAKDGGASRVDAGGDAGSRMSCTQDSDCDDGAYCNGVESCVHELCAPGKPVTCDDGIACTLDVCSETRRACTSLPPDADGDGHYDSACTDGKGQALGDDCDDDDDHRYPGNIEVCDEHHQDEDCNPKTLGERDADGDGFVDIQCCNRESDEKDAKLLCGNDCDDLKRNVSPHATEACDGFDNDCDGNTDEGVTVMMYPDRDFDGHGAAKVDDDWDCSAVKAAYLKRTPKKVCAGEKGYSAVADDCNDCDPNVFPGQLEVCDDKDNDCNGHVDERHEEASWYPDADGDGFGDSSAPESELVKSCEPVKDHVLLATDCDDEDAARNPAADEVCDGKDNDCHAGADYKLHTNDFEDDDGDHIADVQCGAGAEDCNDRDPSSAKGFDEICDGRDNDCDGASDEGVASTVWYVDHDGDGYGDDLAPQSAYCGVLPGRVPVPGDCDDTDPKIHPNAVELCDNINQDCDLQTDETPADSACSYAHASGYCARGACRLDLCDTGYRDCDDDWLDGCETHGVCPNGPQTGGSGGTPGPILPIPCKGGKSKTGDITIAAKADFAQLQGVSCLDGSLSISAVAGLTDLSALASLQWIGGNLQIDGNPKLAKLTGLDNLNTVGGSLVISGNPVLLRVDGLDSLTTVGTYLDIESNAALLDLDNLGALTSVPGDLTVQTNAKLYRMPFQSLTQVGGDLLLQGNPGLLVIDGFNALQKIGGYLDIYFNAALDDVTGFAKLQKVGDYLDVGPNLAITDVSGFPELTEVGMDLGFHDDPELRDITGFGKLTWVHGGLKIENDANLSQISTFDTLTRTGDLRIADNDVLPQLVGFPALTQIDGMLSIAGNPSLTSITGLAALQTVGDALRVESNVQLTSLAGLNSGALLHLGNTLAVQGNVNLSTCQVSVLYNRLATAPIPFLGANTSCCNLGCSACTGSSCTGSAGGGVGQSGVYSGNVYVRTVADMAALANVVEIDGNLDVDQTPFSTLAGLSKLQVVTGHVDITNNYSLTSLSGLEGLTSVGGDLVVAWNYSLTSLAPLSNLTHIYGKLEVSNDPALMSLSGLHNVTTVDGDLNLAALNMASVDDLTSLQSVYGGVYVMSNPGLLHLDHWDTLSYVGGIFAVELNAKLQTISGMPALTTIVGDVHVHDNPVLTKIDGFDAVTQLVSGSVQIYNNAGLTQISALPLLQTVPGSVEIYNDASLTDLTAFPNLTSIGAFLNIQGNTSLLDVTGFAKLAAVHGYFNILNNPTLKNISGFPLLDRVYQDFLIGSNVTLAHVTGFPALHAVDGSFTVADNTQLLDFDGIDTLASVGVDLGVLRNASLTKLDGLASGTLVSVGNDLDIEVNPALTRCRVDAFATQLASAQPGLAGMNHSAANLGCTTCSGLSCSAGSGTLNGQSGTYRGSIVLSGATIVSSNLALYRYVTAITGSLSLTSTSLTSLNGLDNLTSLGGAFDIESNAGLTQCAPTALLSVLQAHGYPAGTAVIMNNLPCSTTCAGAVCQ